MGRMGRKTTKLRVVFDASSKCPGEISLNDALYSGSNLLLWSLYVDDYASGADSVDSLFCLFERLKKVFKEGGFNMRK